MTRPNAYQEGRNARGWRSKKHAFPYGEHEMQLRHWWLAGWHDRDMELAK